MVIYYVILFVSLFNYLTHHVYLITPSGAVLKTTLTIAFGQQNMHNISQKMYHEIHPEKNFPIVYFL
jgi:hypothetical protein